jgi:Major Facilitator Superfamily
MALGRALDSRIWLLAIGTFAVGTDAFVVAGILPLLAQSFGVAIEVAGLLVSTYSFTYRLGTPLLAAMVARWQRHRVVIVTLCGFAVVNIGCALAPSFGVLLALKVCRRHLRRDLHTDCVFAGNLAYHRRAARCGARRRRDRTVGRLGTRHSDRHLGRLSLWLACDLRHDRGNHADWRCSIGARSSP